MKIRQGFVSNSSSSSFLVFFPNIINNEGDLSKIIWTKEKEELYKKEYFSGRLYPNMNMTFEEFKVLATSIIFKDIENQTDNDYFQILSLLSEYSYIDNDMLCLDDYKFKDLSELVFQFNIIDDLESEIKNFDWNNRRTEEYEILESKMEEMPYELATMRVNLKEVISYVDKTPGIFYSFEYSDESGPIFCALEHGGIFNGLPHFIESKH